MFILFLGPGVAPAASAIGAGVSSFAAGIIGGLAGPLFDLLFPSETANATIDGLPPELLETLQEQPGQIPGIAFGYGSTVQNAVGPPPFTGGQCPVRYTTRTRVTNLNTGDSGLRDVSSGSVNGPFEQIELTWRNPINNAIVGWTFPNQTFTNPTTGSMQFQFRLYQGGSVVFTSSFQNNPVSTSGADALLEFVSIFPTFGEPDNCGDPPGPVGPQPLPNTDFDPTTLPPPLEFPSPPAPGEPPAPEPELPVAPELVSPTLIAPSPVEVSPPELSPEPGTEPPPEIEFVPPPVPVTPIPVPVIPTPIVFPPFVLPPRLPSTDPLELPSPTASPPELPEIVDEETPAPDTDFTFPPLLTPEGQIILKIEECCAEIQLQNEDCCEEILDCFDEIKEQLDEIEFQVNPEPPGSASLQLKTSVVGSEVVVSGEPAIIWIRPVITTPPNFNKQIQAINPALTVYWGSYLNFAISGKFGPTALIAHSDNFFVAPKRCTGFGLFFLGGASGYADYYVRV